MVRGRPPLSPRLADTIQQKLPEPARTIVEKTRGEDVLLFASGLSFYALISFVPLMITVIWIAGLVVGDERIHRFATELRHVAPENVDAGGFVQRVADLGTSVGLVALLTALWPASSYGAGLRRSFDRLSRKRTKELKGLKGRGLALIVLLPIFVLGSLLGSYAGTAIVGDSLGEEILGIGLALLIGFAGTALGVALIYRMFPPERLPWSRIARGTLWAAVTISLLSLAFTVFANTVNFETHYGTAGIAALVLIGLWMFLANTMLLVGYRIALDT